MWGHPRHAQGEFAEDPTQGRDYGDETKDPVGVSDPWSRGSGGDENQFPRNFKESETDQTRRQLKALKDAIMSDDWVDRTTPARGIDPTTKLSNPKDVIGSTKLPLHLWPAVATVWGALALLDGMLKYGRNNWRQDGVRATIYIDAIDRHLKKLLEGEDIDRDSGLDPLAHILASAAILLDAKANGTYVDDRNYSGTWFPEWIDSMAEHVKRLVGKHAGKNQRHYTIKDNDDRNTTGSIPGGAIAQALGGGQYPNLGQKQYGSSVAPKGSVDPRRYQPVQAGDPNRGRT